MPPGDLLKRLRVRPFVPFRMHLADGGQLDVTHPFMVVGLAEAVVPFSWTEDAEGRPIAKRWRTIPMDQIRRLGTAGR
jgi:hypothetical protein